MPSVVCLKRVEPQSLGHFTSFLNLFIVIKTHCTLHSYYFGDTPWNYRWRSFRVSVHMCVCVCGIASGMFFSSREQTGLHYHNWLPLLPSWAFHDWFWPMSTRDKTLGYDLNKSPPCVGVSYGKSISFPYFIRQQPVFAVPSDLLQTKTKANLDWFILSVISSVVLTSWSSSTDDSFVCFLPHTRPVAQMPWSCQSYQ